MGVCLCWGVCVCICVHTCVSLGSSSLEAQSIPNPQVSTSVPMNYKLVYCTVVSQSYPALFWDEPGSTPVFVYHRTPCTQATNVWLNFMTGRLRVGTQDQIRAQGASWNR